MGELIRERVCAEVDGGVVVFLIGMRINRLWKVWKWLPVALSMPKMLRELAANPELGLLAARSHFGLRNAMLVQYWKSSSHLRDYALSTSRAHLPAWRAFNKNVGTNGDVGIWHETYVLPGGQMESVYVNMPRYGLGLAGEIFPATGARATAAKRMSNKPATSVE